MAEPICEKTCLYCCLLSFQAIRDGFGFYELGLRYDLIDLILDFLLLFYVAIPQGPAFLLGQLLYFQLSFFLLRDRGNFPRAG